MGRSTTLSLAPKLVRLEWITCQIEGQKTGQNLNCHALANLGPFVTSMLRLLGLAISLSTLCELYAVIV